MSANLSPLFVAGQLLTNGIQPLAGGKIYVYLAGTTTPQNTWTDSTQVTLNPNPLILDSYGRVQTEIWLASGVSHKFVVTDSTGATVGYTYDNVKGVNDFTAPTISEWVASGLTPTFGSSTQMSFSGDQTGVFPVGTRTKSTVTAGTVYSTVSAVSYSSGTTTVTVINDSIALDSGLSTVYTGLPTVVGPSVDAAAVTYNDALLYVGNKTVGAQVQAARQITITSGTSTAYVLTPTPATVSLGTTNQWLVKFHADSGATPTLNISGLGAKSLKQWDASGTKIAAVVKSGQVAEILYDTTDFVVATIKPDVSLTSFTTNQTLADPGSQPLPGGLILKWGSVHIGNVTAGTGDTGTVTFATQFPTGVFHVFCSIEDPTAGGIATAAFVQSKSTTAFSYRIQEWSALVQDSTIAWFALGY